MRVINREIFERLEAENKEYKKWYADKCAAYSEAVDIVETLDDKIECLEAERATMLEVLRKMVAFVRTLLLDVLPEDKQDECWKMSDLGRATPPTHKKKPEA